MKHENRLTGEVIGSQVDSAVGVQREASSRPEHYAFCTPSKELMLNTENSGPPGLYMRLKGTAGNRNAITFGGKEYEKSREKSCRSNRIRNGAKS